MRIALFVTCLADTMFPQAARATVTVLERLGHEVVSPRVRARANTARVQRLAERHLLGVLDPVDIANAAVFAASAESSHITGHVLPVDSGLTIT